jgi:hypothetical protein
MLAEKEL